eukprot:CAMPEP_0118918522 /NCGR_PEP_ID=MMETSP1166-20130328/17978_1 /TAXON_ID=1104430 /ORGANISM="Chrysoreinhardia sp, Strain CCMP3193" /LENGTH=51 /DNA_ID=CAMNT_0006858845 /DNA_START=93 /DNA_END=244 /DNA_ORIENTATION=-
MTGWMRPFVPPLDALRSLPPSFAGGSWDNSDLKGKKGWMNTGFGMFAFNDG